MHTTISSSSNGIHTTNAVTITMNQKKAQTTGLDTLFELRRCVFLQFTHHTEHTYK